MDFAKKRAALCLAFEKKQEPPDVSLNGGKEFKSSADKMFFVLKFSDIDGSTLVNFNNGSSLNVKQRLPIGSVCHSVNHIAGNNNTTEYLYDIYSPLIPRQIDIPSLKGFVVQLKNCKLIKRTYGTIEICYLQSPNLHLRIEKVLELNDDHVSLQEYLSDKDIVDGLIDCFVTPDKVDNDHFEWVLVPTSLPPRTFFLYPEIYEKMKVMFTAVGFGVVVGIGKIAVKSRGEKCSRLINCPLHFELGSSRVCVVKTVEITGYKTTVLIKSKPVKLKSKYMKTYVSSNGSVLIETVAGKSSIGKWTIQEPTLKKISLNPGASPSVTSPNYNYCDHPFFGKIIFSPSMIWSAPTLKVIIGGTINSNCKLISSTSKCDEFFIHYHVLGFHDGERYWRVPDVPQEMFDSKNYLIQNKIPMFGDPLDALPIYQEHRPPFLATSFIEGRFICNQFIKNDESGIVENNDDEEDGEEEEEDDDDMFVTKGSDQIRRQQKS